MLWKILSHFHFHSLWGDPTSFIPRSFPCSPLSSIETLPPFTTLPHNFQVSSEFKTGKSGIFFKIKKIVVLEFDAKNCSRKRAMVKDWKISCDSKKNEDSLFHLLLSLFPRDSCEEEIWNQQERSAVKKENCWKKCESIYTRWELKGISTAAVSGELNFDSNFSQMSSRARGFFSVFSPLLCVFAFQLLRRQKWSNSVDEIRYEQRKNPSENLFFSFLNWGKVSVPFVPSPFPPSTLHLTFFSSFVCQRNGKRKSLIRDDAVPKMLNGEKITSVKYEKKVVNCGGKSSLFFFFFVMRKQWDGNIQFSVL